MGRDGSEGVFPHDRRARRKTEAQGQRGRGGGGTAPERGGPSLSTALFPESASVVDFSPTGGTSCTHSFWA